MEVVPDSCLGDSASAAATTLMMVLFKLRACGRALPVGERCERPGSRAPSARRLGDWQVDLAVTKRGTMRRSRVGHRLAGSPGGR
jgi:hypothetical protein